MMTKLLVITLFLRVHLISAQKSISVPRVEKLGSGVNFNYSVDQISNTIIINSNIISIRKDIKQRVLSDIEQTTLKNSELTTLNLKAITYPNPSTDYVFLSISGVIPTHLNYMLYNTQGHLVLQNKILRASTKIDLSRLERGFYVLQVLQNNNKLKIFKIIKK